MFPHSSSHSRLKNASLYISLATYVIFQAIQSYDKEEPGTILVLFRQTLTCVLDTGHISDIYISYYNTILW